MKLYKIKKSKIDKNGLYANQNIKKGTKIIEYKGKIISVKQSELANFTTHDLRSCAIVNMLKSGMNIAEVRVISGHKSLSQFQRYARIKPSDLLDKINQV